MNDDLIYHQIETGGCRPVIAEFLIYDFRFWYDVEAGFCIFGQGNYQYWFYLILRVWRQSKNQKKAFKKRFMAGYTINSRRKKTQIEDADLVW